ncbi:MAG TPA: hypothetical protein EYQ74_03160 [Planctomycetes bacterium]|nr:hypothetical protein [Planctomycetota bacterium]
MRIPMGCTKSMNTLRPVLVLLRRCGNGLASALLGLVCASPSLAAQEVIAVPPSQRAQAQLEVPVPGPIALVGAYVYPMNGSLEGGPSTVIVRGGRIEAVIPSGPDHEPQELPSDAQVIDVSGLYLVPGLIDGAISHDPDHDPLYVLSSVTTVRDTGNDVERVLLERLPPARERGPGPALLIAGPIIDSSTASSGQALVLADGPSARSRLTELLSMMDSRAESLGVDKSVMRPDFLCFHRGLQPDAWRALIEVAHGAPNLQVWGPMPQGVTRAEILTSGQDGVIGLHLLLSAGKGWHDVTQSDLVAGIQEVNRGQLGITPLMGVFARMLQNLEASGEKALGLDLLSPTYERLWRQEALVWTVQRKENQLNALTTRALASQRRALLELWRGGVALVPGSACPNPWIPPGIGLVHELQQWVRAGIPPLEVLRLATSGSAEHLAPDRGRIIPGQIADLAILAADPAKGLATLKDPVGVVLRGRHLNQEALQAMRSDVRARQKTTRRHLEQPFEVSPPEVPVGDVVLTGRVRTMAYGSRILAERFAVVRTYDGGVTFASHQVFPGDDGSPGADVHLTQVFRGGQLQSFQFRRAQRSNGDQGTLAEGVRVGTTTRMAIRRRNAGGIVDTQTAQESISLVDGSDILNALIVGQFAPLGPFFTLVLTGPELAPGVEQWHLQSHERDNGLHVATRGGRVALALGPNGIPVAFQRRVGSGITELDVSEIQTFGGPGLAPTPGRTFAPQEETADEGPTSEASGSDDG